MQTLDTQTKLSYADSIRKAAYDALCNPKQKLTGTMRRRLMRATARVHTPTQEPKESSTCLLQKFAKRPAARLAKWKQRVSTRLARVKAAIEDAISLRLTKAVDALCIKRDRMAEVLDALGMVLAMREIRASKVTWDRKTGKYVTTT